MFHKTFATVRISVSLHPFSTLCEVIRTLSVSLFPSTSSLPISPRIMQTINAGLLGALESGGLLRVFWHLLVKKVFPMQSCISLGMKSSPSF